MEIAGIITLVTATTGGVVAYFSTTKGKNALKVFVNIFTGSSHDTNIENALDNIIKIVNSQGESIEWLRSELEITKRHLHEAREALKQREDELQLENSKLKLRIAELETQVNALEDELNRRKKYTRKDYR